MDRYSRHIALPEIGLKGQQRLTEAKVLVIGAGGLGCPVLQYLTAAGVGTIGIVDFDLVELSNLQRQVIYGDSSLGKNKALAAADRLRDLNSEIEIIPYPIKLEPSNAEALFVQYDIVVDASDNFPTRYLVNDTSIITNTPLVYGAIHRFEGQVSVFNYQDGPSYRCLFPKTPKPEDIPNCSDAGVLGVLPGIVGSMQANEVLKIILGIGEPLSGRLWCFNALNLTSDLYVINKNPSVVKQVLENGVAESYHSAADCNSSMIELSLEELIRFPKFQFVDVREEGEEPVFDHPEIVRLPMSLYMDQWSSLADDKTLVFFCQQGVRSVQVAMKSRQNGREDSYSLKQGAMELLQYLKSTEYEGH